MNILFDWCAQDGVQKVFSLINTIINVIRWVVPIGLIVMLSVDIFKKVINPDDKEGQKKIITRIAAAIIIFLIPLIIRIVLGLVDIGSGRTIGSTNSASACWR